MRYLGLVVCGCLFTVGCQTSVPRGSFHLPEDSFLTVKRIEALVPPGTDIEQAREIMEIHGFVCTFEESVGIPYLQCNQIKRQHLWPFNGTWMATLYYDHGVVRSVQARYDLNPSELGTKVPKHTARKAREIDRAKDARLKSAPPGAVVVPADDNVMYIEPAEVVPAAPNALEAGPPASVPVEIP